ncbi:MAG: hypothetical protein H6883_06265 [Rhodobiaceae bacterium]|nr:hypothetical protein [Rhodobiaceae bacterium]
MTLTFTIIVLTYDHGLTLRYAIDSIPCPDPARLRWWSLAMARRLRPRTSLLNIAHGMSAYPIDPFRKGRALARNIAMWCCSIGRYAADRLLQRRRYLLPDHLSEIAQLLREHDFVSAKS